MIARKSWTDDERSIVRDAYATTPTRVIAEQLGRSVGSVYQCADRLGLHKSAEYLKSPDACRIRHGSHVGVSTRFLPGDVPHNKGVKGWQAGGRSAQTRFKNGSKPHNYRPVGSERLTKDGYLQRKMTDTGYPPRDWKMVHVMLWEEHNGPLPAGHIVIFRNGNRSDIAVDNLALISRAENLKRNSIHRYPKELAHAMQVKGALQRQINKRDNK